MSSTHVGQHGVGQELRARAVPLVRERAVLLHWRRWVGACTPTARSEIVLKFEAKFSGEIKIAPLERSTVEISV